MQLRVLTFSSTWHHLNLPYEIFSAVAYEDLKSGSATKWAFIGVARGCSGCTCTPQGGEKIFRRIYRENV